VLVDLDHVAESNINRQVHALDSTIGQAKVLAMRERIAQIHPGCEVHASRSSSSRRTGRAAAAPASTRSSTPATRSRPRCHGGLGARSRTLFITCGAAGGKRLAHKVDIDDLALTTHDPLLAQLRYRLRKFHGAPREGKRIGVPCVFSREAVAPPDPSCAIEGDGSLNCHGYGSVVSVTATFGQCAAGWVLDQHRAPKPIRATL
jgi:tRNA A37 threonylcarbamoyladenosine dehydratase